MKFILQQAFRSGKFITGFSILATILLIVFVYPLIVPDPPLAIIGQGTFFEPGIYVNTYDSISAPHYTLNLDGADVRRVASRINDEDRASMQEWLVAAGVPESEIDTTDTEALLELWFNTFDPAKSIPGMTNARRNYFIRLNNSLQGLLNTGPAIIAAPDDAGVLQEIDRVQQTAYVNVGQVPNVRVLPLGTDNFGRDVFTQLMYGTRTSLLIGFLAGIVATAIGLVIGTVAGFRGGNTEEGLMAITNVMLTIPSIVILILISLALNNRSLIVMGFIIGVVSWPWTARAVRAQTSSLKMREHVDIARLAGAGTLQIIVWEIIPFMLSYVVMAFVLQLSAGILQEATLSMLGLGPSDTVSLGIMLQWALLWESVRTGAWWAFVPPALLLTLIAFSLLLLQASIDEIFNPRLRRS